MKKCLFILLCFLVVNVEAKTYYSNYGPLSTYTSNYIEESDTVKVLKKRKYRFYTNYLDGGYHKDSYSNINYPLINRNDFITTPYTPWSFNRQANGMKEEVQTVYYSKTDSKPIRYLYFYNFFANDVEAYLSELHFYNNGQKINYRLTCKRCLSDEAELTDNNVDTALKLNKNSYLIIDLYKYYDVDNFSISFIPKVDKKTYYQFDINISYDIDGNRTLFFKSYRKHLTQAMEETLTIDDFDAINPDLEIDNYSLEKTKDKIIEKKLYRYQDVLYHFYNEGKFYMDGYHEIGNDIYNIKAEDEYIDYYASKVRTKFEIDDIKITNKQQQIEDFVKSEVNYTYDTNMDKNKNGMYEILFHTPFMDISKVITVDIKENISESEIPKEDDEKDIETTDKLDKVTNDNNSYNDVDKTIYDPFLSETYLYEQEIDKLNEIVATQEQKIDEYKKRLSSIDNYQKIKVPIDNGVIKDKYYINYIAIMGLLLLLGGLFWIRKKSMQI